MSMSRVTRTVNGTVFFALAAASVWLCRCGGSGSDSGSDFACSLDVAGQEYCYAYSNLTATNANSARSMCSNQSGKSVSACPTSGLVGCCAITQSGVSFQSCYYFGTDDADEMACSAMNGKWTSGAAALPGGGSKGGNSGGGASGSGGATGPSCSGNGICCPEDYCTMGGAHGYQFPYSDQNDGGGSTAELSGSSCVSGTVAGARCQSASSPDACYKTHWGAGIGFNLNQATGEATTPMPFTSAGSGGVTYALDFLPSDIRMVVGDSTSDYCVDLTSASGTIPWSSFSSSCWNTSGSHLSGPPSKLVSVRFQVLADTAYGDSYPYGFCVTRLSL